MESLCLILSILKIDLKYGYKKDAPGWINGKPVNG
jgi:hypothetical protein